MRKLNDRIAWAITNGTGTMWAAYAFAVLALISLPAALASGNALVIVAWIAQTFLQLVLLPVIMVGQRLQGRETERRDQETHDAVMQELAWMRADHAALAKHLGHTPPPRFTGEKGPEVVDLAKGARVSAAIQDELRRRREQRDRPMHAEVHLDGQLIYRNVVENVRRYHQRRNEQPPDEPDGDRP